MMFTAQEAARLAGGALLAGNGATPIADTAKVTIDSRTVAAGDLFVALSGGRRDGHAFLADAARAGAAAVLVSDPAAARDLPPEVAVIRVDDTEAGLQALARGYRERFSIPVAGITGSCGKTTTKEMVRAILSVAGHPHITRGNLNNHLGLPLTLLGLRPEHDACVVEMGINRAGEMALLAGIAEPTLGLITGAGSAHLEGLGSREGVAREKGRLFAAVAAVGGTCVVNRDDPFVAAEASRHHPPRIVTYSLRDGADVTASARTDGPQGAELTLTVHGETVTTPFFTAAPHQVQNAAAAAALAHALGTGRDLIARGLSAFTPLPMRGREYKAASGATIIDDTYNANPDSALAAVTALMAYPAAGRRIAVLGDMLELGEGAAELHRELGRAVARLAPDRLVCVGALSARTAEGAAGLADVRHAAGTGGAAGHLDDLGPGDVVLVKGSRGMAMERIVADLMPEAEPDTEARA